MRPDASDSGSRSLPMPDTSRPHAAHSAAYHFRAHSIVCYRSALFDLLAAADKGAVEYCGTWRDVLLQVPPPYMGSRIPMLSTYYEILIQIYFGI